MLILRFRRLGSGKGEGAIGKDGEEIRFSRFYLLQTVPADAAQ